MKRLIALAFVALIASTALTGCYHNQIIVDKNYNSSATEPDMHNGFQMYLIEGLIPLGDNPIDLNSVCPQGAGIVEVQQSFLDGLINHVIGAILSFQDTKVYCAKAAAANDVPAGPVAEK